MDVHEQSHPSKCKKISPSSSTPSCTGTLSSMSARLMLTLPLHYYIFFTGFSSGTLLLQHAQPWPQQAPHLATLPHRTQQHPLNHPSKAQLPPTTRNQQASCRAPHPPSATHWASTMTQPCSRSKPAQCNGPTRKPISAEAAQCTPSPLARPQFGSNCCEGEGPLEALKHTTQGVLDLQVNAVNAHAQVLLTTGSQKAHGVDC